MHYLSLVPEILELLWLAKIRVNLSNLTILKKDIHSYLYFIANPIAMLTAGVELLKHLELNKHADVSCTYI